MADFGFSLIASVNSFMASSMFPEKKRSEIEAGQGNSKIVKIHV